MIKIGDTIEIAKLSEEDMQTAKGLKVGDRGIVEMYVPVPVEKGGICLVRFDKDLGLDGIAELLLSDETSPLFGNDTFPLFGEQVNLVAKGNEKEEPLNTSDEEQEEPSDICEGNKVMIDELDDIDKYYTDIKEGMIGRVVTVLNFKHTTLYRVEVNGLFGTYGTACLKREQFTKIAD